MVKKPRNLSEDKLINLNESYWLDTSWGVMTFAPLSYEKNQWEDFFNTIQYRKKGERIKPIQTKKLKNFSELCKNNILYRCDYISLSIYDAEDMRLAPLFHWRQDTDEPRRNDSNSNLKNIPFINYDPEWFGEWATIKAPVWFEDFWNYSAQYSRLSGQDIYIISVVWRDTPVPIMRISLYDEWSAFQKNNKMEWRVDFYGELFRLQEITGGAFSIAYILHYLLWDYAYPIFHKSHITRYDYKIDFFAPKGNRWLLAKELFQVTRATEWYKSFTFKSQNQPYGIMSKDWKETYTWRKTVSLSKGKSKWINTRFYHKKADIRAKGKEFLYHDYMEHEGEVRRFELEFNSQFCTTKKISLWQELEQWQMSDRVLQYIGVSPKTNSFSRQYMLQEVAFDRMENDSKTRYYRKLVKGLIHFWHTGWNLEEIFKDVALWIQIQSKQQEFIEFMKTVDI